MKKFSINDKIGNWTILEGPFYKKTLKTKYIYYLCKCSRGTIKVACQANLVQGKSYSCGRCNGPISRNIGSKFNYLAIIEKPFFEIKSGIKREIVKVKCICGKEKISRLDQLGISVKSYGCKTKEMTIKKITKHGDTINKKSKLYSVWDGIKGRCYSKK